MENVETGATELINKQIEIVVQLQYSIIEALNRNDSGSAQRLIDSCDKAFGTFIQGIKAMAIDVSNLKNALKSAGNSASTDVIQSLSDRLAQLEQKIGQFDPGVVGTLQTDIADIKAAIEELNNSVLPAPSV